MMKVKLFKNDVLTIANNVIISKDNFIQIRNITRVWHGRLDVNIPYFKIICAYIAGIALQIGGMLGAFSAVGTIILLAAFAVTGYYVYLWSHYTLNFELTSGEVYAFTSMQESFLVESYEKVKNLLENPKKLKEAHEFNFNNCEIKIVEGDNIEAHNVVNVKDSSESHINFQSPDNSVNIKTGDSSSIGDVTSKNNNIVDSYNKEINYTNMYEELNKVEVILKEQNNLTDLEIIEEAKEKAKNKDNKGLKSTLKKLSKTTLDIISATSGLATIAEFIKSIINL